VDVCPVEDTLEVKNIFSRQKVSKKIIAAGVVLIFVAITGIGMLNGKWHNKVSKEEYLMIHKERDAIGHPTSASEIKELNRSIEERKANGKEGSR
jgi:hypothetical protein